MKAPKIERPQSRMAINTPATMLVYLKTDIDAYISQREHEIREEMEEDFAERLFEENEFRDME